MSGSRLDPATRDRLEESACHARVTATGTLLLANTLLESRAPSSIASPCCAARRPQPALGPREQAVEDVLAELRPAFGPMGGTRRKQVTADGGVILQPHGSCSGCGASFLTLQGAVRPRLKERLDWVTTVELEADLAGHLTATSRRRPAALHAPDPVPRERSRSAPLSGAPLMMSGQGVPGPVRQSLTTNDEVPTGLPLAS